MSKKLKKVDAVVIGFGWTGAIMSKELIEAGLNVVALERGPAPPTALPVTLQTKARMPGAFPSAA